MTQSDAATKSGEATEAEAFLKYSGIDVATMSGYIHISGFDLAGPLDSYYRYSKRFTVREQYIARFGFAVLTQRVVAAIAKYSPLLEIGSGSGYWAHELRKAGADCVATDPGTGKYGYAKNGWVPYVEIDPIDGVAAVAKYPNRALLIVWPDYDDPWAAEALRDFDGTTVLYVGEGPGGCTGDEAFHELLDSRYALKEEIDIPQFDGLHDSLQVHMRLPVESYSPSSNSGEVGK
jgi:hypothetical protein